MNLMEPRHKLQSSQSRKQIKNDALDPSTRWTPYPLFNVLYELNYNLKQKLFGNF